MSRTYVLVHGAWHGGWCWQRVAYQLRGAGHEVLTPTLTGLGDRSHLRSPAVNLSTHVLDVVSALDFEDVRDVILVGHSYAGLVVTGVAVAAAARVDRVVCLDGFVPEAGECGLDLLPPHAASHYRDSVVDVDGTVCIPPRPLERLGVTDPGAVRWLEPRLVPQPAATYSEPVTLGATAARVPGTYLQCTGWASPFGHQAQRARDLGWDSGELDADHEIMATAPALLSAALLRLAATTSHHPAAEGVS